MYHIKVVTTRKLPSKSVEKMGQELKAEAHKNYHRLRHAPRLVAENLKIPAVTIRAWQTRNVLDLDANNERQEGSHRLYSDGDVVKLYTAHKLSQLGIPVPEAASLIDEIGQYVGSRFGAIFASARAQDDVLFIWRDGDKYVGSRNEPEAETAYVILHVDRLCDETFGALGIRTFSGTAEEIRKFADEMKRGGGA